MDLTIHTEDQLAALADDVREYATQFLNLSKASTENTVAMCEVLYKAKQSLESKDFQQLQSAVGYGSDASSKTIIKYLQIGKYAEQFRPYLDRLPNTWTTLYEITHLPADKFMEAMEQGLISSATRGADIKVIANKAPTPSEPIPKLTLALDKNVSKETLKNLMQELEAMRIDFTFSIEANPIANTILATRKTEVSDD